MTGFNHGMTGAVIALAVKQPALAIPLALVSHYATDLIPHYGFKQKEVLGRTFNRFLAADFGLAVASMAIVAVLFPNRIWLLWSCMIAAALPDLVWWFYRKSAQKWPDGLDWFTAWHDKINRISHVSHLNYDAAYFAFTWAIVLAVKIR